MSDEVHPTQQACLEAIDRIARTPDGAALYVFLQRRLMSISPADGRCVATGSGGTQVRGEIDRPMAKGFSKVADEQVSQAAAAAPAAVSSPLSSPAPSPSASAGEPHPRPPHRTRHRRPRMERRRLSRLIGPKAFPTAIGIRKQEALKVDPARSPRI
jgi:hypothetical protein